MYGPGSASPSPFVNNATVWPPSPLPDPDGAIRLDVVCGRPSALAEATRFSAETRSWSGSIDKFNWPLTKVISRSLLIRPFVGGQVYQSSQHARRRDLSAQDYRA
jgi:hypothetical protein